MNTKPKKPARNAEIYLVKEDKRIYKDLIETLLALKKSMYPNYMPSGLSKTLSSTAENAYQAAEKEASKFWGTNEICAVRGKEREGGVEFGGPSRVGRFYADCIHARLVITKKL